MAPIAISGRDSALEEVIRVMESDMDKLRSTTEVYNAYVDLNGHILQRRTLVNAISKYFGEQLLLLSCKGLATLLVFRVRASQLVKI